MAITPKSEAAILRQKEVDLKNQKALKSGSLFNETEMKREIQKLKAHQIEMEMQNTELKLANEQAELYFQKYIDLKVSMPSEEELQENNLRLELAMRAAKMTWWKIDRSTGNVTFGKRKAEMLGYPPEKFKHYTDFTALLHPDDFERSMCAMQNHLNGTTERYETEYRMLTKSNGYHWFYDIGSVVRNDSDGNPLVVTGFVLDIDDRKKADESLISSETRYRRLFETAQDGIIILDAETGMIMDVNPFLIDMLGYSRDQFLDKAIWEIGFFKDIVANHDKFIELQQNEYVRYENLPLETADGRKKNVEFVSNVYLVDEKKVIQCNIRDITKRRLAETSLVKLKTAIEKSEVSFVIADSKGNMEYANPFFTTLTGYSPAEYIGQNPKVLKSGYHPKEYYEDLWNTINSGRTWEGEFYNRKKNGEMYWENAIISPVENANNEITHFVAIKTDITEAKKINSELIEAKEHAEESDRLKSAFLANMSHEVRTPLNSIIGFSELLADPDFEKDQKNDFIQHIISNGNSLLTIISDIMDISKLESGQITIRKSQINARIFIQNVKEKFAFQSEGTNLELRLILPDNDNEALIFADPERLSQIINNLITNAFKFTKNGRIEIGFQPKDKMVEFFVKDTGIGISSENHTKIFKRFEQVDHSTTREFGGNGLGLAICRKLVELMGGKIWLESEPGKGSIFYFTLPAHNRECV